MIKTTILRAALLTALAALLVSGCGRKAAERDESMTQNEILRFVPANTPYLFASGAKLPDAVLDKLGPKIDEILEAYRVVLKEVFESALSADDAQMGAAERQRFAALSDELAALLSREGLRGAGFERNSSFAFFGNGLLPVLRIEISDADSFDAAIARLEAAAGGSMSVAELGGTKYRYVGDQEMSLVIGAFDGNAVFALLPRGFDDEQKRQLLGLTPPRNTIASSDTLSDIAETYGFNNYYLGFVDARRVASTLVDEPTGLDVPLLASLENEAGEISPVCKAEIQDVVAVAPRMVFGYHEISTEAMSGSLVVELRSDIAAGLATISNQVPGLGDDPGGLFSLGLSLNLLSLRDFYEARLDALEADPFECEYFAELQAGVAAGREALNKPIPPVAYGFRGLLAVVDDIGEFDMASPQPPEDIDASILIAMDDARAMVAMGSMFSAELAGLNLKPDGVPVLLDLPQLKAVGKKVYAAMLEDAIALSVGADAEARVKTVLTAAAPVPAPMFSMTMDAGRYYALIADGMMQPGDGDGEQLSPAAREALRDAMRSLGEMYDRMKFDIRFNARGMEVDTRVTLKD